MPRSFASLWTTSRFWLPRQSFMGLDSWPAPGILTPRRYEHERGVQSSARDRPRQSRVGGIRHLAQSVSANRPGWLHDSGKLPAEPGAILLRGFVFPAPDGGAGGTDSEPKSAPRHLA